MVNLDLFERRSSSVGESTEGLEKKSKITRTQSLNISLFTHLSLENIPLYLDGLVVGGLEGGDMNGGDCGDRGGDRNPEPRLDPEDRRLRKL